MTDIRLRVYRTWTERFEDEESRKLLHVQRAKLIHGLADALDLEVKDWGETDSTYPREVVEIILALGTAGVFTAMVSAFKSWLERDKILDIEIITSNGDTLRMRSATSRDIRAIVQKLGLETKKRKTGKRRDKQTTPTQSR